MSEMLDDELTDMMYALEPDETFAVGYAYKCGVEHVNAIIKDDTREYSTDITFYKQDHNLMVSLILGIIDYFIIDKEDEQSLE